MPAPTSRYFIRSIASKPQIFSVKNIKQKDEKEMSFIILALGSNSGRILLEKVTTALRNAKLAHLCYFSEIVSTNLFLNSIIIGARLRRILFFVYP